MKNLSKEISNLDDFIDGILEPINDYKDTIEDLATPIKGLLALHNLRKRIQLKNFLKGLQTGLKRDEKTKSVLREKLFKLLKDDKNILYLLEIVENSLQARSLRCTAILGLIAGKKLHGENEVDSIDDVLVYALQHINDQDLAILEYLKNNEHLYQQVGRIFGEEIQYSIHEIKKEISEIQFSYSDQELMFSIEKLKRDQILNYGGGGIGLHGNSNGTYIFGPVSRRLLEYLQVI